MCTMKFIWPRTGNLLAAVSPASISRTIGMVGLAGMVGIAGLVGPGCTGQAGKPATPPARKAVIVELFTSEGCSSCPPADALLGRVRQEEIADGLEVIPLGLHVDYWNFQGWSDRFSSADYSRRQEEYARILHTEGPYTPQMVVDGTAQFVGGDASRARHSIAQAALQTQRAEVEITLGAADKLLVRVKALGKAGATGASSDVVMLAITEDNLATQVKAGENSGRELRHAAVVRELRSLGRMHEGSFEAGVPLKLKKEWKRDDLRVVVFVQDTAKGTIDGAAAVELAKTDRASVPNAR